MIASIYSILLSNLAGTWPEQHWQLLVPPEKAHQDLVHLTGEDFGFDVRLWYDWLVQNDYMPADDFRIEVCLEKLRRRSGGESE